jgi:hypothetical protein
MKPSPLLLLMVTFGLTLLSCTSEGTLIVQPTPIRTSMPTATMVVGAPTAILSTVSPVFTQTTITPTAIRQPPTATITPLPPTSTPSPTEAVPTPTVVPSSTSTPPDPVKEKSPKKGLAAPPGPANCDDLETLRVSWYYNWTVRADAGCEGNPAFVPRIWGANNVSELPSAIENAKASGWLIGFNEPNLPGIGFISPEDGAKYWKQIEDAALPQDIKLVSPAPNPYPPGHAPGDNYGYTWLMAMVQAYHPDPQVNINYLIARYNDFKELYPGVKLWILEYNGCFVQDDPERVMREVTPWFEEQEWIARYAWYVSRPDNNPHSDSPCTLINREGELQDIGELYQSLY